jgi:hypothetical protein
VLLLTAGGVAFGQPIVNGDFSSGLTGWTTTGPVSDGGGFAVLEEGTILMLTSLEQQFILPVGAKSLSFDYGLSSTPDGTSGFPFADGLSASLLDPATLDPILSTPGFSDFFFEDRAGAQSFDPSLVSIVGNRVTLYLTSVPDGTNALIVFDLLGGDDGFATQATIDNVAVFIPAPGAGLLAMIGLPLLGRIRRRIRTAPQASRG